jgi:glycerophosphoryl diester phosphodiesterase
VTGQPGTPRPPARAGIPARRAAVSAHQGGSETAPPGTYRAYTDALAAGAEYAELDVRQCADGVLVACHSAPRWLAPVNRLSYPRLCQLAGYEVPRAERLLTLLAGRAIAQLDLKDAASSHRLVARALGLLGPDGFVVTTGDAGLIAGIKQRFPEVSAGLALGADLPDTLREGLHRARRPARSRLDRVAACRADWAVLHRRLATPARLADCRARGLRTMVWTVNNDRALARWLADPGVDVVVTDHPARALALRERLA